MYDTVQSELEEKIRRLEEDRHSIDITSGRWKFSLGFFSFVFNLLLATNQLTVHIVFLVSFRLSARMLFSCRLGAGG